MRRREGRLPGLLALSLALVIASAWSAPSELLDVMARLPPAAHAQLQRQWQQWSGWSPQQRGDFRQRAKDWDALPRAERDARRERYQAWRALPASEQVSIQAATTQLAAMPSERQQAWRAQFDALDRSERRGWLLGPSLGVDYAMLQPLLAQVPAAEHAALMQALRTMSPQQRIDLGVLAQRTPPTRRDELRRGLLAAGPQGRGDWLWQQMQH
ncbi:DUF3106 domain-containing protein [Lysobacter sp. TAF61]|uniref:DUF3106 domain-containing protein n=1 Tax=Lysobacter sp. TAF61 TaxID=3233072 RepID=UPI003F985E83